MKGRVSVQGVGDPITTLTSSGGHHSGWYASYWNAFLFQVYDLLFFFSDINVRDNEGNTALHEAVLCEQPLSIEYLVSIRHVTQPWKKIYVTKHSNRHQREQIQHTYFNDLIISPPSKNNLLSLSFL